MVYGLSLAEPHRFAEPKRTPIQAAMPLDPDYQYPISYKDHVYTSLSENARTLFYAINTHPSCLEKKGECIPRGKCIEKKMLYLSRVCYYRDLVCCYLDTVEHPIIEHITKYPPLTRKPTE